MGTPIYKEDIITALEEETNLAFTYKAKEGRNVCAAGCVVRRFLKGNQRINKAAHKLGGKAYGTWEKAYTYIGALASFWETLGEEGCPVEEARVITLDWVEKTFPEDEILGEI